MNISVTSDGITLMSDCGNMQVALKCTSTAAGVFITNKKDDTHLSLYNEVLQGPSVAFYTKDHDTLKPASLAIGASKGATLQFQHNGETVMLPLELLLKLKADSQ